MKKLLSLLLTLIILLPAMAAEDPLCFTANTDGSSVTLNGELDASIFISTDNTLWKKYNTGSVINLNENEKIYFSSGKGINEYFSDIFEYYQFEMSGSISASGNIMSLLKKDCSIEEVPSYAFNNLFKDCVSLITAPKLPANIVNANGYSSMFDGCINLTTAPELPAMTLGTACYAYMFNDCKNLTKSPNLPAIELAPHCYNSMFKGCEKLNLVPNLDANIMESNCYASMFKDCINLGSAPALNSTNLADNCYNGMFENCSKLTVAPNLPATLLPNNCYTKMFSGCTNLINIKVAFHEWTAGTTTNWMNGVNTIGTFEAPACLDRTKGANYIPNNWEIKSPEFLCFTAVNSNARVSLIKVGTPDALSGLQYSTNGFEWQNYTPGTTGEITLTNTGDYVYFKATSSNPTFSKDGNNYYRFKFAGNTSATGNLMSLLDETCNSTNVPNYAFNHLFTGGSYLISAPILPATTVGNYGYHYMFNNCSNLTSAPELPATTIGEHAYSYMFYNCSKLVNAPEVLPAETTNTRSYYLMFRGCSSLTKAPRIAATTHKTASCYYMFQNCTALTEVPDLEAQNLGSGCYSNMFEGCSSLVNAPELPATTLTSGCYYGMFKDCTSLKNAPELPATVLVTDCYYNMFNGCTKLNRISVSFTKWLNGATTNWVNFVPQTGIFDCPDELDQTLFDVSHIPYGWSLIKPLCFKAEAAGAQITLNKIGNPAIVAMNYSTDGVEWLEYTYNSPITLANVGDRVYFSAQNTISQFSNNPDNYYKFTISDKTAASGNIISLMDPTCTKTSLSGTSYCFTKLFENCTNLTKAPNLSPTTLASACYFKMFFGCTGLTEAPNLPATKMQSRCYMYMFSECSNLRKIPNLISIDLAMQCYSRMFSHCNAITSIPKLPANVVANNAYQCMFAECTGITEVADLEATQVGEYAYSQMFYGCNSLTQAPEIEMTTIGDGVCLEMFKNCTNLITAPSVLKSTNLKKACYKNMFDYCTKLEIAPELPAESLAPHCYAGMFKDCRSLTEAPKLIAETLQPCCYDSLFMGCSMLNNITVEFSDWQSETATINWVKNCPENGIIYCPKELGTAKDNNLMPANFAVRNYPKFVALNANGYSTYSASTDVKIVEGGGAYACTVEGGTIYCDSLMDVPAGTGVMLHGEPGATIKFCMVDEISEMVENHLLGTTTEENTLNAVPNKGYVYVLSGNQFKRYAGANFSANKAYFCLENDPMASGANEFRFIFGNKEENGNTTSINEVKMAESVLDNCFNLQGQRIAKNNKGMQIMNGKVVFVK